MLPRNDSFTLALRDNNRIVFKASADMTVLHDILISAFKERIALYGAPDSIVSQHLSRFLGAEFKKKHKNLNQLVRNASLQEFIPMLSVQFQDYVLTFTNEKIEQLLLSEINATRKYNLALLLRHLKEEYFKKGKKILMDLPVSADNINIFHTKWKQVFKKITKKPIYWVELGNFYIRQTSLKGFLIFIVLWYVLTKLIEYASVFLLPRVGPFFDLSIDNIITIKRAAREHACIPGALSAMSFGQSIFSESFQINLGPMTQDFQKFVTNSCHAYVNQQKHNQLAFPVIQQIVSVCVLQNTAPGLVKIQENPLTPPKAPKRRAITVKLIEPVKTEKQEEKQISGPIEDGKGSTYFRLAKYEKFAFYRHNPFQQEERLSTRSGQENLLFTTIKNILIRDSTVHAETWRGPGLKRLGEAEKEKFPNCSMKLRFNGSTFGNLRIGVGRRMPDDAEKKLLGNRCQEIYSPRVPRTK